MSQEKFLTIFLTKNTKVDQENCDTPCHCISLEPRNLFIAKRSKYNAFSLKFSTFLLNCSRSSFLWSPTVCWWAHKGNWCVWVTTRCMFWWGTIASWDRCNCRFIYYPEASTENYQIISTELCRHKPDTIQHRKGIFN